LSSALATLKVYMALEKDEFVENITLILVTNEFDGIFGSLFQNHL